MRTRAALLLVTLAAVAWAGAGASPAAASCAAGVELRGVFYVAAMPARPVEHGRELRGGAYPGCNDTNGPREPDRPARLDRLAGVAAAVAVGVHGEAGHVYLGPGFLPELPGHPLHDALFERPPQAGCAGRPRVTRSGRILYRPGYGVRFVMKRGSRETDIRVGAETRVAGGPRRAGLPYFVEGGAIRVTGRRCSAGRLAAETIRLD